MYHGYKVECYITSQYKLRSEISNQKKAFLLQRKVIKKNRIEKTNKINSKPKTFGN